VGSPAKMFFNNTLRKTESLTALIYMGKAEQLKPHQFKKGQPGFIKSGPNKINREVKSLIKNFVDEKFEEIEEAFSQLSPKEKCQMYVSLLGYIIPKKATIEHAKQLEIPKELEALNYDQLEQIQNIIEGKQPTYQIENNS
jgi:hypothetical protein